MKKSTDSTPVIKHFVQGVRINGEALCRCCVCGEVHPESEMSLTFNKALGKTYAVCKGEKSSATNLATGEEMEFNMGDCELIASTARRSI